MASPDDNAPTDAAPSDDDSTEAAVRRMTIDELAAATQVPSRTIRYYQSKGALQKPEIRGRVAYYGADHIERLALISQLKERGLRIRAIRDLATQIERGEVDLGEWLGLEERLKGAWLDETGDDAQTLDEAALDTLFAGLPDAALPLATTFGLVERRGDKFLVRSRGMVEVLRDLHAVDIDVELAAAAGSVIQKHVQRMNEELVELFVARAGRGFGKSNDPTDLERTFAGVRGPALRAVTLIFASSMQSVLGQLVESGRAMGERSRGRRRKKK